MLTYGSYHDSPMDHPVQARIALNEISAVTEGVKTETFKKAVGAKADGKRAMSLLSSIRQEGAIALRRGESASSAFGCALWRSCPVPAIYSLLSHICTLRVHVDQGSEISVQSVQEPYTAVTQARRSQEAAR